MLFFHVKVAKTVEMREFQLTEEVCLPVAVGHDWVCSDSSTQIHKNPQNEFGGFVGAPSGFRTPDPLIKSQLLYQLS